MRILSLLILFLIFSCEKEIIKDGQKHLPRKTEKGRGIFACYINDETYISKRQDEVVYNKTLGYLFIENNSSDFDFRLFVYQGLFNEGIYAFSNTSEEYIGANSGIHYGIAAGGINELNITKLDLENRIISGTFQIDLEDENGNQKLIRDGRFDLEITIIS